jgi:transposase-like protein
MKQQQPDKNAADILAMIGRALHPGLDRHATAEEWPARLAADLGITRETMRSWRRGHDARFGADHPAMDDLMALAERRADEVARVRDELRAWLQRNRS